MLTLPHLEEIEPPFIGLPVRLALLSRPRYNGPMSDDAYYHICGYPIIFETRREDGDTVAIFRDGEQAEPIEICPNCGEVLLLGDLTPEPFDEWW